MIGLRRFFSTLHKLEDIVKLPLLERETAESITSL